ncbi:hypothetical protein [Enterovirga rhinocerotis]|uniref:Uncharacterized protein n=1 Tax=Enterovirga rhinocerotis TaxID=1339210 RepID=A0A4R7BVK3_9HYPH|nr:hypothetical protein [Enterovirga rhinocerotis]TDR88237.1 hypothetical protein EV668_4109 [Enterovirga rhinocerotis]
MATDNIVLEHLSAIRGDIAMIKDDMRGLKAEMTSIRQHIAAVMTLQEHDHTDIAMIKVRLDRIERRLELADG